jgi:hypothetical protein
MRRSPSLLCAASKLPGPAVGWMVGLHFYQGIGPTTQKGCRTGVLDVGWLVGTGAHRRMNADRPTKCGRRQRLARSEPACLRAIGLACEVSNPCVCPSVHPSGTAGGGPRRLLWTDRSPPGTGARTPPTDPGLLSRMLSGQSESTSEESPLRGRALLPNRRSRGAIESGSILRRHAEGRREVGRTVRQGRLDRETPATDANAHIGSCPAGAGRLRAGVRVPVARGGPGRGGVLREGGSAAPCREVPEVPRGQEDRGRLAPDQPAAAAGRATRPMRSRRAMRHRRAGGRSKSVRAAGHRARGTSWTRRRGPRPSRAARRRPAG